MLVENVCYGKAEREKYEWMGGVRNRKEWVIRKRINFNNNFIIF